MIYISLLAITKILSYVASKRTNNWRLDKNADRHIDPDKHFPRQEKKKEMQYYCYCAYYILLIITDPRTLNNR